MRVTICLGGSTFNPEGLETETIEEMIEAVNELREKNHEILMITGGGNTSRTYIKAGKKLDISDEKLDQLGIMATRLNARLLISALGDIAGQEPLQDFEKAIKILNDGRIPVLGGIKPGQTTDAVAAELANVSGSDLLIFFTDVDGIYTSDPKKDEDAEKIDRMTPSELGDLMSKMKFTPGINAIIDPRAGEIMRRTDIRTLVLGKDEIKRLPQIIEGSEHSGTEISPNKNR